MGVTEGLVKLIEAVSSSSSSSQQTPSSSSGSGGGAGGGSTGGGKRERSPDGGITIPVVMISKEHGSYSVLQPSVLART